MSIRIVKRQPAEHVLYSHGAEIGCMRKDVVSFRGFVDETDARTAGAALCATLADWYGRRDRTRRHTLATPWPGGATVSFDEPLLLGGTVVGRIVRDASGVRIDLALPEGLMHAVAVSIVGQLCATLATHLDAAAPAVAHGPSPSADVSGESEHAPVRREAA